MATENKRGRPKGSRNRRYVEDRPDRHYARFTKAQTALIDEFIERTDELTSRCDLIYELVLWAVDPGEKERRLHDPIPYDRFEEIRNEILEETEDEDKKPRGKIHRSVQ